MPLNLKNPNAIVNHEVSPALDSLVKDWGPTLNRWALKIENRLDSTHKKAVEARLFIPPPAALQTTPASISDGLIHGDAIWAIDPAVVQLRDDFNVVVTNTVGQGELGWLPLFNGGTSFPVSARQYAPANIGCLTVLNDSTANDCVLYQLAGTNLDIANNGPWPLLDYPSWKMIWVFGFDWLSNVGSNAFSMANKIFYIGLWANSAISSFSSSRPPIFIGCRYDTTAPLSDSTFKLETVANLSNVTLDASRNNTQGTVVDTGVSPLAGAFHRLEIQCTIAGTVTMSFDGGAPSTFTIPNYTAGSTSTGGGSLALFAGNTITRIIPAASASLGALVFGNKSKLTVSGFTTGANNGAKLPQQVNGNQIFYPTLPSEAAESPTGVQVVGQPGIVPMFMFGSNSATSVTSAMLIDFFSFVWNPGVGGGTGTPVKTKVRYW